MAYLDTVTSTVSSPSTRDLVTLELIKQGLFGKLNVDSYLRGLTVPPFLRSQ